MQEAIEGDQGYQNHPLYKSHHELDIRIAVNSISVCFKHCCRVRQILVHRSLWKYRCTFRFFSGSLSPQQALVRHAMYLMVIEKTPMIRKMCILVFNLFPLHYTGCWRAQQPKPDEWKYFSSISSSIDRRFFASALDQSFVL